MLHPWRDLAGMPNVDVVWTDQLPVHVRAATDGRSTIWMAKGLVQRERRSSLAHELEHIRRGHRGCQPPAVEDAVREHAARRLLPDIVHVADGIVWPRGTSRSRRRSCGSTKRRCGTGSTRAGSAPLSVPT